MTIERVATGTEYELYLARKRREYGDRFVPPDAPQFVRYFQGPRIKVRTTYPSGETYERTGTVSITTGWKPAFLLMRRSNAFGSSDLLRRDDEVIAVQGGRKYIPLVGA